MKKKFYILMCLASLVLMVTACGGKEKIKEKLRAATEAVKERKEAAASEKGSDLEMDKQGDRPDNGAFVDPSLTPAQRKAIDKENPWFARNFRMELTAKSMGNKVNVEIQKSGKILYYHFWNNSGNVETLILLDEGDYKIYQISSKNKVAQLKATSDSDYYAFFCDKIGNVYGIVHTAQKEKKVEQDDSFVQSSTQESVGVEDVRWGGFDCEKNSIKDLKHIETTDIVWIEKNSGAVVHRKFSVKGGAGMGNYAERMKPQPSVTLLTFSPDPSLIPTSQEGYKLVK